MFIPIERRASILKMVEKEVSPLKPKHQYYLPLWGECVYGTQPWKEMRLLCESMFIPIERQTLVFKMVEREVFFFETNASISVILMRRMFMVPNHEIRGDYYVNPCLSKSTNKY